jgi:hypothetical protein
VNTLKVLAHEIAGLKSDREHHAAERASIPTEPPAKVERDRKIKFIYSPMVSLVVIAFKLGKAVEGWSKRAS